jgi:hypothetical protein
MDARVREQGHGRPKGRPYGEAQREGARVGPLIVDKRISSQMNLSDIRQQSAARPLEENQRRQVWTSDKTQPSAIPQ